MKKCMRMRTRMRVLQILLRTSDQGDEGKGTALVYATSWWNATHVDEYLQVSQDLCGHLV